MISLNEGKGQISKFFKKHYCDAWGWLALACEAFVKGDKTKARKYYFEAVLNTWAALEAFSPELKERSNLKVLNNHETPAFIQEFMFRTNKFWDQNPEAKLFFSEIANQENARKTVIQYHQHKTSMLGYALKPDINHFQIEEKLSELKESMRQAIELDYANT